MEIELKLFQCTYSQSFTFNDFVPLDIRGKLKYKFILKSSIEIVQNYKYNTLKNAAFNKLLLYNEKLVHKRVKLCKHN